MTTNIGRRGLLGLLGGTAIAGAGSLANGRSPGGQFEVRHKAAEWKQRLGLAIKFSGKQVNLRVGT